MKTKKNILILFAFLLASITMSVGAQTVAPDSALVAATEQVSADTSGSGLSYVEESLMNFLSSTGFAGLTWETIVMIVIACVLLYLAIVKQFEPLLLLPIAFGMLLTNLPGAGMFNGDLFAGGHVHWESFVQKGGMLDYLYLGVKLGLYPCLILWVWVQ